MLHRQSHDDGPLHGSVYRTARARAWRLWHDGRCARCTAEGPLLFALSGPRSAKARLEDDERPVSSVQILPSLEVPPTIQNSQPSCF